MMDRRELFLGTIQCFAACLLPTTTAGSASPSAKPLILEFEVCEGNLADFLDVVRQTEAEIRVEILSG